MRWEEVLERYARVAVVGGPRTGKTTLVAGVTDRPVIHGDEYNGEGWEKAPERIKGACEGVGSRFLDREIEEMKREFARKAGINPLLFEEVDREVVSDARRHYLHVRFTHPEAPLREFRFDER